MKTIFIVTLTPGSEGGNNANASFPWGFWGGGATLSTLLRDPLWKCHGVEAGGTDKGPTLLTTIYAPYLHADLAFTLAVERGVPGAALAAP